MDETKPGYSKSATNPIAESHDPESSETLTSSVISQKSKFTAIFHHLKHKTVELFTKELSKQQIGYLLALLLFFVDLSSLAILITCYLLLKEFWPKIIKLWNSSLGKLLLFFIYAVVGNFALVTAAGLVSDVSGVAADYLPYTHNFAVLLMVPAWLVTATAIILSLLTVWFGFYIAWLVFLKLLNHEKLLSKSKTSYPIITVFVKISVITLLSVEIGNIDLPSQTIVTQYSETDELPNEATIDPTLKVAPANTEVSALNPLQQEIEASVERQSSTVSEYKKLLMHSIAWFIYRLEADKRSRCETGPDQKVVELNHREALFVNRHERDYQFTIGACVSAVYPLNSD